MLNETHIEGYVTKKQWMYGGDRFLRVAVYRDPDRPRKEADRDSTQERDQPDYVTVKLPAALIAGMPIEFKPSQRVQVHGWLESRQYEQSLAEFLDSARQDQGQAVDVAPELSQKVVTHRSSTWVVADRIQIVNRGEK
jgi:hypothetical protein